MSVSEPTPKTKQKAEFAPFSAPRTYNCGKFAAVPKGKLHGIVTFKNSEILYCYIELNCLEGIMKHLKQHEEKQTRRQRIGDKINEVINPTEMHYTFDSDKVKGLIKLYFGFEDIDGERVEISRMNAICSELPFSRYPGGRANIEKFSADYSLANYQEAHVQLNELRKSLGFNGDADQGEIGLRGMIYEGYCEDFCWHAPRLPYGHVQTLETMHREGYMSDADFAEASKRLEEYHTRSAEGKAGITQAEKLAITDQCRQTVNDRAS